MKSVPALLLCSRTGVKELTQAKLEVSVRIKPETNICHNNLLSLLNAWAAEATGILCQLGASGEKVFRQQKPIGEESFMPVGWIKLYSD